MLRYVPRHSSQRQPISSTITNIYNREFKSLLVINNQCISTACVYFVELNYIKCKNLICISLSSHLYFFYKLNFTCVGSQFVVLMTHERIVMC